MMNNPEFRRNLWLELTPYRLIGMPVVLGAVFYLFALLNPDQITTILAPLSLTLYGLIVFLWGTRMTSEALVAEVRDRTWDHQRMSSIGPWSMTWGKLLGSAVFPWYGGLMCLAVYVVLTMGDPSKRTINTAALFLVSGLFAHGTALLSSMQALKKDRAYNRSQAASYLILGVIVAGPVLSLSINGPSEYTWFGQWYESRVFILTVAALFLVWTVIGIYRLMRAELQMKNGPFVWLAFACFLAIFTTGFVNVAGSGERLFNRLAVAGMVSAALTYLMALSERKDPVAFKRLLNAYGLRAWRRVLHELPCWVITLVPLSVSVCGMLLTADTFTDSTLSAAGLRLLIVGSLFFLLRDLGLLLFFNLSRRPKRADMVLVLCLALLYGVVPGILHAMELDVMTAFFWPRSGSFAALGAVAAGGEAIVALLLAARRWRNGYAAATGSGLAS